MSENVLSPDRLAEEPLAGEVAVDPATGRPAGRAQAAGAAAVQLPGRARRRPAGAGAAATSRTPSPAPPGVEALTPIVLTAPALVIGLTAPFAGRIVDRLGRKRLLVGALVVYAFVGTAPLWLPSLQLIVVSRVLVGLTEAAIMTCCTTLLADYFHGSQRERYFGLQVVFTTVAATIFFGVGGALGRAELADAVLALRRQPAAGRRRRPLHLAARAAGRRRPRAPRSCRRCPGGPLAAPVARHAARRAGLLRADRRAVLQARRHRRGLDRRPSARSAPSPRWAPRSAPSSSAGWPGRGPAVTVPLAFALSGRRAGRPGPGVRRAAGRRLRGGHRVRQRPAAALAADLGAGLADLRAARPRHRRRGRRRSSSASSSARWWCSRSPARSDPGLGARGARRRGLAAAVGVRALRPTQAAEPALAAH